jgi:hypothetical protein
VAEPSVIEVRRLIDGLRRDRRQHPYAGRREYFNRAGDVADAIEAMLACGMAADAVPLARRAIERVIAALQYMDDSTGSVGDQLRVLMDLYARACQAAPPDPRRLAAWLFGLHVDGPGWPRVELTAFADALGERGLAEVTRLNEERRTRLSPDDYERFSVQDLREQLAGLSGDVDAHVAVLAEDLRGASRYHQIVAVLRTAGRDEQAEQWARRGLAEEPSGRMSDQLHDQLVDLLLDTGREDDAVAARREAFERRTLHHDYRRLRGTAEKAGKWPELRDQALDLMRERARTDPSRVTYLLSVLVEENLLDEAWTTATESSDRLHESQWLQLIESRENDHPADVIGPYQLLVERKIDDSGDKYRYPRAIKTIRRLRDAYRCTGDDAGFAVYLDDLRTRHKRKTSFIAKLDAARL